MATKKEKAPDSSFKPGQDLVFTVTKVPQAQDASDTIARLMRLDPVAKRGLRRAHRMRQQRVVVYNRGNRDWVKREKSAKVVRVAQGATWTMPFSFDLARDIQSVQKYLSVQAK